MLDKIKCETSVLTNTIYIGEVNKDETEFLEKEDRTDEVLCAVRDYMVGEFIIKDKNTGGFKWTRKDGKIVTLKISVTDKPENT